MTELEPDAQTIARNLQPGEPGAGGIAAISIAISLKRIADQLAGAPYDATPGADNSGHRLGLVDGIMLAIEQGITAAANK